MTAVASNLIKKYSIIFYAIFIISILFVLGLHFTASYYLTHNQADDLLRYDFYQLKSNYLTVGLVRRGLLGVLATMIGALKSPVDMIRLHLILGIWLAIPTAILIRRLGQKSTGFALYMAGVVILAPQLFLAWSWDIGRSDLFSCGFIAWAFLFTVDRRYLAAYASLFVGSLAHESAVVYGVPLCLMFGYLTRAPGEILPARSIAGVVMLLAMLVIAATAENLLGPSPSHVAHALVTNAPLGDRQALISTYITVGGVRGLFGAECTSWLRPGLSIYVISCVIVFFMYGLIFFVRSRQSIWAMAVSALTPMIAMSIIAIDYGRWLSMAIMTAWLAAAGLRLLDLETARVPRRSYISGAAVIGVLLALGPGTYGSANWAAASLADAIWPAASENVDLDRCDPGWRSVIGLASTPRPAS